MAERVNQYKTLLSLNKDVGGLYSRMGIVNMWEVISPSGKNWKVEMFSTPYHIYIITLSHVFLNVAFTL